MRIHATCLKWARRLSLGAALLAAPLWLAQAVPTVDGVLDADYGSPVATSPKDNLLVDAANSIDDPANPAAKALDVTNLYVTNSGNALYIYVQLPYYNFGTANGNWAITFHLGGANDSTGVPTTQSDPYGTNVIYAYGTVGNPQPNAVLISNVKSANANGWAYLMNQGNNTNYNYDNQYGDIFKISQATVTSTTTNVHSLGPTGAEIAYQAGDGTNGGIEIKIPFSMFAIGGALTAPQAGDVVRLQFYDDIPNRAAIDLVPFEEGGRKYQDPGAPTPLYNQGLLTQWASYTIKQVGTPLDVLLATLVDATHIGVKFSDSLSTGTTGSGAGNPANYTVIDLDNKDAAVPVSGAEVDATDPSQVNLAIASIPYGHHVKITVNNVQSASGVNVTTSKNFATLFVPVQVTFRLTDNMNLVGTHTVSLTGNFINWQAGQGKEIDLPLKSGTTNVYESAPVWVTPQALDYKYRLDYSDWDTLNPTNHHFVLGTANPQVISDVIGGDMATTWNLTIYPDKAIPEGSSVYVTGGFNGWSTDTTSATPPIKMTPAKAGATTGLFTASSTIPHTTWGYKYIVLDPAGTPDWTFLNQNNREMNTLPSTEPFALVLNDTAGTPPASLATRILRIYGGLETAPQTTDAMFPILNADGTGGIDLMDAVKILRG